MRTLKKLHIPTLIFINKIDRIGAKTNELVLDIKTRLFPQIVVLNSVTNIGSSKAETSIIPNLAAEQEQLRHKISLMECCPIIFGSAITGAGIYDLMEVIKTYFPPAQSPHSETLSALVFKTLFNISTYAEQS